MLGRGGGVTSLHKVHFTVCIAENRTYECAAISMSLALKYNISSLYLAHAQIILLHMCAHAALGKSCLQKQFPLMTLEFQLCLIFMTLHQYLIKSMKSGVIRLLYATEPFPEKIFRHSANGLRPPPLSLFLESILQIFRNRNKSVMFFIGNGLP